MAPAALFDKEQLSGAAGLWVFSASQRVRDAMGEVCQAIPQCPELNILRECHLDFSDQVAREWRGGGGARGGNRSGSW
jgi:hypothetical protein